MMPARTNDSQTAAPATAPVEPSSEKMPAPTIDPTPMKAASRVVTYRRPEAPAVTVPSDPSAIGAIVATVTPPHSPGSGESDLRVDGRRQWLPAHAREQVVRGHPRHAVPRRTRRGRDVRHHQALLEREELVVGR